MMRSVCFVVYMEIWGGDSSIHVPDLPDGGFFLSIRQESSIVLYIGSSSPVVNAEQAFWGDMTLCGVPMGCVTTVVIQIRRDSVAERLDSLHARGSPFLRRKRA